MGYEDYYRFINSGSLPALDKLKSILYCMKLPSCKVRKANYFLMF